MVKGFGIFDNTGLTLTRELVRVNTQFIFMIVGNKIYKYDSLI
jgi:hypothetical protein